VLGLDAESAASDGGLVAAQPLDMPRSHPASAAPPR
jgi:hypothetical protein